MAKKSASPAPAPLTFDLPVPLIAKIEAHRKRLGLGSTSEVVRHAIGAFDFGAYQAAPARHRQISVRLSAKVKATLVKASRKKQVSVGELLRVALDALPTLNGKSASARGKQG